MNTIIKTTEISINTKPRRKGNAKPVFCITDGTLYASATDAAIANNVHHTMMSQVCRGKVSTAKGKQYCYVKDLANHLIQLSESVKDLYTDASIYRAQKAEEERIEAERKAKEEAERKRTERIATIKERREKLAIEMESLYTELMELENEGR